MAPIEHGIIIGENQRDVLRHLDAVPGEKRQRCKHPRCLINDQRCGRRALEEIPQQAIESFRAFLPVRQVVAAWLNTVEAQFF